MGDRSSALCLPVSLRLATSVTTASLTLHGAVLQRKSGKASVHACSCSQCLAVQLTYVLTEYAHDLVFWYMFSFGHPAQAAVGKGWVQEWLARVQGQPLSEFNSTTNASYHTPDLFPIDQPLYVDATHDTSKCLASLQFCLNPKENLARAQADRNCLLTCFKSSRLS